MLVPLVLLGGLVLLVLGGLLAPAVVLLRLGHDGDGEEPRRHVVIERDGRRRRTRNLGDLDLLVGGVAADPRDDRREAVVARGVARSLLCLARLREDGLHVGPGHDHALSQPLERGAVVLLVEILAQGLVHLLLRESRELGLAAHGLVEVLGDDEHRAEGDEADDPDDEPERLARGHEHDHGEADGQGEQGDEAPADDLGVDELELRRARRDLASVGVVVEKGADDGRDLVVLDGDAVLLADHEVGLGELLVEQRVDVEQVPPPTHADEQRGDHEEEQHEEVVGVVVAVVARDGLAHGVDAVGEGQPRVYGLEEARHHLDGVGAGRAGNLQNDEKDAERLADVLEGDGEGIDDVDVDERLDNAGEDEGLGVEALDAHGEVADAADDRLEGAEQYEEHPAAEVALPRLELSDALVVDLNLVDGHEHEAPDPEGEVGVEGRHARAVVGYGVDGLVVELDWRRHERGDAVRVDAEEARDLLHGL